MVKFDEYHIKPDPIRFAPNWKGGRIKGSCGYVYVKKEKPSIRNSNRIC
jgi:hypothetical protein